MASSKTRVFDAQKAEAAQAHEDIFGPLLDAEPWADFAASPRRFQQNTPSSPPPTSPTSPQSPGLIRRVSTRLRRRFSGRTVPKAEERYDKDQTREREPLGSPLEQITGSQEYIPNQQDHITTIKDSRDKSLPPLPAEAQDHQESLTSRPLQSPTRAPPRVTSRGPPRRSASLQGATYRPTFESRSNFGDGQFDRSHNMLNNGSNSNSGLRRSASLRERYPNDPTVRPLDMLRQEHRAADRAPHLHNHHRKQPSDTIDRLDTTGGIPHHHEGPFDAASPARNRGKRNAPVDAVHETLVEALKATPREYVLDAERKHVPIQGVASIPPGHRDMSGNVMDYAEGTDMQREGIVSGGPLARWDGVNYHDDDLKGKGEASYTTDPHIDNAEGQPLRSSSRAYEAPAYELRSFPRHGSTKHDSSRVRTRQRSATEGSQSQWKEPEASTTAYGESSAMEPTDIGSSRPGPLASIKRRIGSLRRK